MELTILGSGTCVPSLKRAPCSALIRTKEGLILLDAGPGIMRQLLKMNVQINDIDAVCLSHFHLDHCADLAPFIFASKYSGLCRDKKLTLAGGTGIDTLFDRLDTAYGNTLDMSGYDFEIIALNQKGGGRSLAGLTLSWTTVEHKPESRAFRFEDSTGFSIVYSGDTDESDALVALAQEADILICEAALPDDEKVPGHLTPCLAGKAAAKACVKKLVLTHFYPQCDAVDLEAQCRKTFNGPLVLAQDLMQIRSKNLN